MTEPYYTDSHVTLWHGDCLDVLRQLDDNSVDAVVTDPPYGLEFMGKEWDAPWKGSAASHANARVRRASEIDDPSKGKFIRAGDNAYEAGKPFQLWCETWAVECLRVLKPGGHMLAFGGTRTWHRLAAAIEDAGFEIRDSIAWLYGSGFPKSLDVSKAIERRDLAVDPATLLDDEARFCQWMRECSGLTEDQAARLFTSPRFLTGVVEIVNTATVDSPRMGRRAMVPTSAAWESARPHMTTPPEWVEVLVKNPPKLSMQTPSEWKAGKGQGTVGGTTPDALKWKGWGTALKPAFEPIVVGRKPLIGTVAANVLAHGTGALNIDGCRVGTDGGARRDTFDDLGDNTVFGVGLDQSTPAASVPGLGRWPANVTLDHTQAAELDRQSGVGTSNVRQPTGKDTRGIPNGSTPVTRILDSMERGHADFGGASRFFPTFRYEAKAPTHERPRVGGNGTGRVLDDRGFATISQCPECGAKGPAGYRGACDHPNSIRVPVAPRTDQIAHPTVKPLDLMRWLVRLVTPPNGVVLDPFAGSGTTAEACVIEGFTCITIEREADYLPLIVQRLTKPIQPDLFGGAA